VEKRKVFNKPYENVQTLAEIWYGKEIDAVRKKHIAHDIDAVEICSGCTFKDTYEWIPANEEDDNRIVDVPSGIM